MANLHGTSNCPIIRTVKCLLEETGKCPVEEPAHLIGKKWTILILRELLAGERRFNELQMSLKEISPCMLSNRLNELERNGIVNRKAYAEVPLRVEYSLTEKGQDLRSMVGALADWGTKWDDTFSTNM